MLPGLFIGLAIKRVLRSFYRLILAWLITYAYGVNR
jgi:SNF family Na+-dependent transporter